LAQLIALGPTVEARVVGAMFPAVEARWLSFVHLSLENKISSRRHAGFRNRVRVVAVLLDDTSPEVFAPRGF
jgi:hypothetical protein